MSDLTRSPASYPVAVDAQADRFAFVALGEGDYRAASFLDGRILAGRALETRLRAEVATAVRDTPIRLHFIFHVGHVGSTLVSRLVGEHSELFSLREPEALRTLATANPAVAPDEPSARIWLQLWSRTWRPRQTTVIKATSFVSEIGGALMRSAPEARAVLMFASPLAYLRGIFAGPASREELHATAGVRRARLERRLGVTASWAPATFEGECVAMSWLAEIAALDAIDRSSVGRTRWIDFDRMLAEPRRGLRAAIEAFGSEASEPWLDAVLAGPILRRYSKGPEHAYSAALRQEVAMQAEREHGAEIARGMAWLGAAAREHPHVGRLLQDAARRRAAPFATRGPDPAFA